MTQILSLWKLFFDDKERFKNSQNFFVSRVQKFSQIMTTKFDY